MRGECQDMETRLHYKKLLDLQPATLANGRTRIPAAEGERRSSLLACAGVCSGQQKRLKKLKDAFLRRFPRFVDRTELWTVVTPTADVRGQQPSKAGVKSLADDVVLDGPEGFRSARCQGGLRRGARSTTRAEHQSFEFVKLGSQQLRKLRHIAEGIKAATGGYNAKRQEYIASSSIVPLGHEGALSRRFILPWEQWPDGLKKEWLELAAEVVRTTKFGCGRSTVALGTGQAIWSGDPLVQQQFHTDQPMMEAEHGDPNPLAFDKRFPSVWTPVRICSCSVRGALAHTPHFVTCAGRTGDC